jgi:tRNA threonylcarbamoyladenosine biosynthesis protein TsaE
VKRKRVEITTKNSSETILFGEKISQCLKRGDLIFIKGDLGAGKSTLIKGIAKGLGVEEEVKSPSFIIVNEFKGREIFLYHVDLYRIEGFEIFNLGIEEFLKKGVVTIEWANKIENSFINKNIDLIDIEIEILDKNKRRIKLNFKGKEIIERCFKLL